MNPQKDLEELLDKLKKEQRKPKLLLHSCCAPCSTYVLSYLSQNFSIVDYFFNPNMSTLEEHEKRSHELERLIKEINVAKDIESQITYITSTFQPKLYHERIKGFEQEPEKGKRCDLCFKIRLEEAAKMAVEQGCEFFATTLTISPLKSAEKINEIGKMVGEQYGVNYLPSDFKKKGGYLESIKLSKKYQLYRQNYCGCIFSKQESERKDD